MQEELKDEMMNEGRLQFRVGLFVIVAMALGIGVIFRLGEARWLWNKTYRVTVIFDEAPGVFAGTPVRKNGVTIGHVRKLDFDTDKGGVAVQMDISERHQLRKDSAPRLSLSILGDASIEFISGKSKEVLKPGSEVAGESSADPMKMVARLDAKVNRTLESFATTSQEFGKVAKNINALLETNSGNLEQLVENAAVSLQEFTKVMRVTSKLIADPKNQQSIQATLASLPELVQDTRKTIVAVRSAVQKADQALANVSAATAPLAERSESITQKLDRGLGSLDVLLVEMSQFARYLSSENGTLKLLASDPELYRNLSKSAGMMETLMRQLELILGDARVTSDKIARHPELLGLGGAIRGSNGTKNELPAEDEVPVRSARGPIKQTSDQRRARE
ncbi:MAG: MlaD family protein [Planctomycetales bacterium]